MRCTGGIFLPIPLRLSDLSRVRWQSVAPMLRANPPMKILWLQSQLQHLYATSVILTVTTLTALLGLSPDLSG